MNKQLTFEQALKRLEEITSLLDNTELSLENAISLYSEGSQLTAFCKEQLNVAEQKITEINCLEN